MSAGRPTIRPNADHTDWRYRCERCGRMSRKYTSETSARPDAAAHDCANPRPFEREVVLTEHSRFAPERAS